MSPASSKGRKFYQLSIDSRRRELARMANVPIEDLSPLFGGNEGLSSELADSMIENVVGTHALPLGIAQNFIVNGREVLVPMAIEEPSVVAAASFMAKLARAGGGFTATSNPPEMIGQMQILELADLASALEVLLEHRQELLEEASRVDPILQELGGGAKDIQVRQVDTSPIGGFLILELIYDVRDAMGANAVNTAVERLAPRVEQICGGRVHLRILTNLADRRLARASCTIPLDALGFGEFSAKEVRDGIIEAWAFAAVDPHRAATHNKGIMNGVDAVVVATGNDWRAVEAGAHAYAARKGRYTSLSVWEKDTQGNLVGTLEIPLAVGIIGGATKVHPSARAALKLMKVRSANELAEVIVSVGLAQNLGALRALSTEGIQRGHMALHARQVAIAAGAQGERIEQVAAQLIAEKKVRLDRAQEILAGQGSMDH